MKLKFNGKMRPMLPKSNRIKTEKEFKQVFRNSKKIETEHFKIFIQNVEAYHDKPRINIQKIKSMYDESGKFVGNVSESQSNNEPSKSLVKPNQIGKLGVIISAKFGKAHDRNKCKRRIRNLLNHYVKENNVNIVIQVKSNIKDFEFDKLKTELDIILM